MNVLVFNAGSSSLKFSRFQADDEHLLVGGGIDWSSEPARLMLRPAGLGGVHALVFTAGVGENAPEIRRRACECLNFVGIELDEQANLRCKPDTDIASPASAARVLVIATREDLTIVRDARRLLARTNLESPHPLTK
jgi:acetate kinase